MRGMRPPSLPKKQVKRSKKARFIYEKEMSGQRESNPHFDANLNAFSQVKSPQTATPNAPVRTYSQNKATDFQ
jgi:hypothetical protein